MKKYRYIIILLMICLAFLHLINSYYSNLKLREGIDELTKSIIKNDIIEYQPFEYNGYKVRLYPESTLTKDEIIDKYPNAYQFAKNEFNIKINIDNKRTQELLNRYYMIELDNMHLQQELRDFASIAAYYANIDNNNQILRMISKRGRSQSEIDAYLPSLSLPTQETREITHH